MILSIQWLDVLTLCTQRQLDIVLSTFIRLNLAASVTCTSRESWPYICIHASAGLDAYLALT